MSIRVCLEGILPSLLPATNHIGLQDNLAGRSPEHLLVRYISGACRSEVQNFKAYLIYTWHLLALRNSPPSQSASSLIHVFGPRGSFVPAMPHSSFQSILNLVLSL